MTVSIAYGKTMRANPSLSDDDPMRGMFISPSGCFLGALTDSILTVFSFADNGFSHVGSLDIVDIVDSAGSDFNQTEGTFSEVCWDSSESLIFVSTMDKLIGVVRIERFSREYDIDESSDSITPALGDQIYSMRLATVLLFPVDSFLLAPSPERLIVISRDKRVMFLIDWKNYQSRAGRFIIPRLNDDNDCGSPCVNSILPNSREIDWSSQDLESVRVQQAMVLSEVDALVLVYANGTVRSLAYSKPSEEMCVSLPCPGTRLACAERDRLALVPSDERKCVYIYSMNSHSSISLLSKARFSTDIHSLSFSETFLAVGHGEGASILDRSGTSVLASHNTSSACSLLSMCLRMRILVTCKYGSSEIEIIPLVTSSNLFSKSFSKNQDLLLIGRDSLQLYTFPNRDWRYITYPPNYDRRTLLSACVQLNPISQYILAVGDAGFALWSASTLSSASSVRREGRWEVLAEKSQESQIGKIDLFGFLSETVFFTHSKNSSDILLWSVHKRIDLGFTLGVTKLQNAPNQNLLGASDSSKGFLVLAQDNRMDVFHLRGDSSNATYCLDLVLRLPCDFPCPIRQLVLVSNYTVLGLGESNELFARTGERICGNVDKVFYTLSLGLDEDIQTKTSGVTNADQSSTGTLTPPRAITPPMVETPSESADSLEDIDDLVTNYTEPVDVVNGPVMYFIGERDCRFCTNVTRVPKLKDKVIHSIRRRNPIIFIKDVFGIMSVWSVAGGASHRFSGRLQFVVRFEESESPANTVGSSIVPEVSQALGVSGKWGVMASISSSMNHVSLTSAIHPILMALPGPDAHAICRRIEHSLFFTSIAEMWLHSVLTDSLPILAKIEPHSITRTCLTAGNEEAVCSHPLVRTILDRLLTAFHVLTHFPSVYTSVFAAAVRKSEPHLTFPLATCGALSGRTAESLFEETLRRHGLRDAALLLVVIQEGTGPVVVREKYAIPLFRESLLTQDYQLAREIAHFHFSYSSRLRSPINKEFSWKPSRGEEDVTEELLRSAIETVVVAHLNFLVNETMDWLRLVRFIERMHLVIGEWLLYIPHPNYQDIGQLLPGFRLMLSVCPPGDWFSLTRPLIEGFQRAKWITHWKALVIAAESTVLVRDCLEQTKEDNSSVVTDEDVQTLLDKYI